MNSLCWWWWRWCRKLGELGFERSAKKCKEKFENVNKYYKRTKEGRVGRQDGKNYRFFSQLEALYATHNTSITTPSSTSAPNMMSSSSMLITHTPDPIINLQASARTASSLLQSSALAGIPPPDHPISTAEASMPAKVQVLASSSTLQPTSQLPGLNLAYCPSQVDGNMGTALHSSSQSSSSSDDDDADHDDDSDDTDVDDDVTNDNDHIQHRSSKPHPDAPNADPSHALPPTGQSKKRKRKSSSSMMAFFESLLKRVIDKQEQMHQKFLQAMEKRESDRMIREEAWRRQEMARLSKEHELRMQERSSAAARDAALIAFLQKATGQTPDLPTVSMALSAPIAAQPVQAAPPLLHQENALHRYEDLDSSDPSSKRWLKPEVLHLIELHSSLQAKFTEAGPKGPLWEEIANGMAKRGYPSRTAKRCKEKWENINKYFKRAKESSKKRPENAKTCPYFHELDALYRKGSGSSNNTNQIPYKPSIELAQEENTAHQPFASSGQEDVEGTSSLQIQPANVSTQQAAACSASNPNDTNANNHHNDMGDALRNLSSSNGILQSVGSMHLSMDTFRSLNTTSPSEHTALRSGFATELGLSIQQQSSSLDLCQHKPVNQSEFGKPNAGGEDMASGLTEIALQSCTAQETKASLAPLPNSTSFMASMLQKLGSGNILANNNQQGQ
ncbi:hypothetical protein L7F22_056943 [Adiantum nelumboides]|nr:hypothetical protein [Adiantum nelumboides]